MLIHISRFACTQVKDQNGQDDSVSPLAILSPELAIDDDCILGEASALLFDRKPSVENVITEGR